MNMLEKFIETMQLSEQVSLERKDNDTAKMYKCAAILAEAFLDAENTVQCKNRNCRKPVVNDKPLGRKKEYCDNKCRMAERLNRVKSKELK